MMSIVQRVIERKQYTRRYFKCVRNVGFVKNYSHFLLLVKYSSGNGKYVFEI